MADKTTSNMSDRLNAVKKVKSTPIPAVAKNSSADTTSTHYRPSRAGKKMVGGRFDPAVSRQINILAAEKDSSVERLVGDALNLLFAEHGLPQIAQGTEAKG